MKRDRSLRDPNGFSDLLAAGKELSATANLLQRRSAALRQSMQASGQACKTAVAEAAKSADTLLDEQRHLSNSTATAFERLVQPIAQQGAQMAMAVAAFDASIARDLCAMHSALGQLEQEMFGGCQEIQKIAPTQAALQEDSLSTCRGTIHQLERVSRASMEVDGLLQTQLRMDEAGDVSPSNQPQRTAELIRLLSMGSSYVDAIPHPPGEEAWLKTIAELTGAFASPGSILPRLTLLWRQGRLHELSAELEAASDAHRPELEPFLVALGQERNTHGPVSTTGRPT